MREAERIAAAARAVRDVLQGVRLGVVLGSGLRAFADRLGNRAEIAFDAVPHWPVPHVTGHGAGLVAGDAAGGVRVACLTGRVHRYEGFSPREVVRAVRTLCTCGVPRFLLTNAAGGIADGFVPGDLMVIDDHLNLTGSSPLEGAHEPELGPRFPDQSAVWDPALRAALHASDPGLRHGVYAGLLGPAYETPAEVRMLRRLGADAVGMSTVHEAIALHAMGARVAGVSLISNRAAGLDAAPLDHGAVLAAGRRAEARLGALLESFCRQLPGEPSR